MSKGHYAKKSPVGLKICLIVACVLLSVALVALFLLESNDDDMLNIPPEATGGISESNGNETEVTIEGTGNASEGATEGDSAEEPTQGTTERDSAEKPTQGGTEGQVSSAEPTGEKQNTPTEPKQNTQSTTPGEEPTAATEPPVEVPTQPPVEIVERVDAEYEEWLAAAMMVCISMEYPEFELEGIYAVTATALTNKYDSKGVYIIFSVGGTRMAMYSQPIEAERSASGTKDISTEAIGYATYDLVGPASINTSKLIEIKMEDLGELIAQSLLISIYER